MGKDAVPDLIPKFQESHFYVRVSAAETLGAVGEGSEDVVPALIQTLKDPDANIRSSVAAVLGNIKEGTGGDSLFELSLEDLMNIVDSIPSLTQALENIGTDAVPALIQALQNPDANVRGSAAGALGSIGEGSEDVVPALIEALKDPDSWVRAAAIEALKGIGTPEALKAVN